MERLGERTRDIRFYSNKNGDIVCLHSKWARNYARWLEEQAWVQSYQVGCPLDADIRVGLGEEVRACETVIAVLDKKRLKPSSN